MRAAWALLAPATLLLPPPPAAAQAPLYCDSKTVCVPCCTGVCAACRGCVLTKTGSCAACWTQDSTGVACLYDDKHSCQKCWTPATPAPPPPPPPAPPAPPGTAAPPPAPPATASPAPAPAPGGRITVAVDTGALAPRPFRFGVQAWSWWSDDDARMARLLRALPRSFGVLRWSPVLFSDDAPSGATDAEMDAFVAKTVLPDAGVAKLRNSYAGLAARGGDAFALFWQPPSSYRFWYQGMQYFDQTHVADYASFVASCMLRLHDAGMPHRWVELFNEPDGYWITVTNTMPAVYAAVVSAARAALDRRGLGSTLVAGPSLSTMALYPAGSTPAGATKWAHDNVARYLAALTPDAKKAVGALTFHAYDRIYADKATGAAQDAEWLDRAQANFTETVLAPFDAPRSRDWITSEFSVEVQALGNETYHHDAMNATCYPDLDSVEPYPDAEQWTARYAVETFAYALMQINAGVDAAVLWDLADRGSSTARQYADLKCFGLFDRSDAAKPVHDALVRTLLGFVPDAAALRPVTRSWRRALAGTGASCAAFAVAGDEARRLVVACANTGAAAVPLRLSPGAAWRLAAARSYDGAVRDVDVAGLAASADGVDVDLPPTAAVAVYFAAAGTRRDPVAGRARVVGRSAAAPGGGVAFDMPGVALHVAADGAESLRLLLRVRSAPGGEPSRFAVSVDGGEPAHFDTAGIANDTVAAFPLLPAAGGGGTRSVVVRKVTEANWNSKSAAEPNYVVAEGFETDAGATLRPPTADATPKRVEFLGDSITAGFCNLCPDDESLNGFAYEDYSLSWAHRACDLLGAECHAAAWSGFGVVANYNDEHDALMPEVYNRTLATVPGSEWDFSAWVPDVVVVNLGTNDRLSHRPGNVPLFAAEYQRLVAQIAQAYGAAVRILLACGPMDSAYCDAVRWAAGNATAGGVRAGLLDQRAFLNGSYGPKCCGHPSAEVDEAMGSAAAAAIAAAAGWPQPGGGPAPGDGGSEFPRSNVKYVVLAAVGGVALLAGVATAAWRARRPAYDAVAAYAVDDEEGPAAEEGEGGAAEAAGPGDGEGEAAEGERKAAA